MFCANRFHRTLISADTGNVDNVIFILYFDSGLLLGGELTPPYAHYTIAYSYSIFLYSLSV